MYSYRTSRHLLRAALDLAQLQRDGVWWCDCTRFTWDGCCVVLCYCVREHHHQQQQKMYVVNVFKCKIYFCVECTLQQEEARARTIRLIVLLCWACKKYVVGLLRFFVCGCGSGSQLNGGSDARRRRRRSRRWWWIRPHSTTATERLAVAVVAGPNKTRVLANVSLLVVECRLWPTHKPYALNH